MITITSRYFNQHTSKVQKAAERAPVIITRLAEPAPHDVLENAEPARKWRNAVEMLAPSDPTVVDIELEIPPRSKAQQRGV
ncbi:type II toxin-antitoxin system Phd/YefM family antitoxin [uncultured Cardiobacterium sp.]|uniref:type II toxin-antitoxin system Phd/YefM family antitoxin n=1 Tax=uncultured Cardiobacterium sp. TaxID=417619 RepID=UPI00260FBAB6|nr:type II toxin-antitoxin system Phd/YefM family antitoxin [uncultured Cardiobacterium sp.]